MPHSLRTICRRSFAAIIAVAAAAALSACSNWWIGSGGWGVSETLPGGVNVGINAPWNVPQGPPPPPYPYY